MSEYKISKRYAISLLESAEEKNNLNNVASDIELIVSAIHLNKQFMLILSSPVIKPDIKLTILEKVFKSKISSETMNFLKFLIEKNRENLLDQILNIFLELRAEKLGIVNVEVKTQAAFTEDQIEKFKSNLEILLGKKVRLSFKIDTDIIGGFVAKVEDTVYDASLKHQLELLKKQLLKGGALLN